MIYQTGQISVRLQPQVIFHPKMKILSPFAHPQVVPNLYEFFFLLLFYTKDTTLSDISTKKDC